MVTMNSYAIAGGQSGSRHGPTPVWTLCQQSFAPTLQIKQVYSTIFYIFISFIDKSLIICMFYHKIVWGLNFISKIQNQIRNSRNLKPPSTEFQGQSMKARRVNRLKQYQLKTRRQRNSIHC